MRRNTKHSSAQAQRPNRLQGARPRNEGGSQVTAGASCNKTQPEDEGEPLKNGKKAKKEEIKDKKKQKQKKKKEAKKKSRMRRQAKKTSRPESHRSKDFCHWAWISTHPI